MSNPKRLFVHLVERIVYKRVPLLHGHGISALKSEGPSLYLALHEDQYLSGAKGSIYLF